MSITRDISKKLVHAEPYDDDDASEQFDATEPMYKDFRSSGESQLLQEKRHSFHASKTLFPRTGLNIASALVALTLISLSISQLYLLLRNSPPTRRHRSGESAASRQPTKVRVLECGTTVAEAKAKGCTWDELSKAWLPRECPRYGLDAYKTQGMLANPHQNATSWPYYWDRHGKSALNLDHVAADEQRDMTERVWTTSRQHLTHCAATLKRTIWSYENGHGHYDAISQLSHAHHCLDTLLRGAIRAEGESVDHITTRTRVHVGYCAFAEWD